jgi:NADPH-dependent F420 reductase
MRTACDISPTALRGLERHSVSLYSAAVAPSSPASSSKVSPVAVIGASGALGFGLALRLAHAGVPIAIGSRDAGRAAETAERASALVPGGSFSAHDNAGAARAAGAAGTVFLSVPFRNQSETLDNLKHALSPGQLLIDATVPLAAAVAGKATRMLGVWQGSAAQQALEMAPEGVRVVSALHTVSAASLSDLSHPLEQDVLVCGDSREDKRQAAQLIERIDGLRCVDCGRLEMSRTTESLTAMLISVNARYKAHAGIRLTSLPEQLWQ